MKAEFVSIVRPIASSKFGIGINPIIIIFKANGVYRTANIYDYRTARKAVFAIKRGKMPNIQTKAYTTNKAA